MKTKDFVQTVIGVVLLVLVTGAFVFGFGYFHEMHKLSLMEPFLRNLPEGSCYETYHTEGYLIFSGVPFEKLEASGRNVATGVFLQPRGFVLTINEPRHLKFCLP